MKTYHEIITETWQYLKKYLAEVGHVDFEKLVKEGCDLADRYKGSQFAIDLVIAVQEEIDRKDMEARVNDFNGKNNADSL